MKMKNRLRSLIVLLVVGLSPVTDAFSKLSTAQQPRATFGLNGASRSSPARVVRLDSKWKNHAPRKPSQVTRSNCTALFSSPLATAATTSGDASYPQQPSWKKTTVGVVAWFVSLSYFIVRNYKIAPWIPLPFSLRLSKRVWVLVHALSNMFFTGGVVLSTMFEWLIVSTSNSQNTTRSSAEVVNYWFTGNVVSSIDKIVVLPALTLSIVSGFAQTAIDYGSMATAPKHIRRAIHILATFAMWWIATDLTTQHAARKAVRVWYENVAKKQNSNNTDNVQQCDFPRILYWRRWSNVVSCLFVAALYGMMALKPGHVPQ